MKILQEPFMKHFLPLALVVTSLFLNAQTRDDPIREIKGTVTDQSGNPVPAATVYAVPQDPTFDGLTPRSTKTDRDGVFDFPEGFQLGEYKLYSQKGEEGYLDPFNRFYADLKSEAPKVDLTENHRSATVTVTLGKRAGVLIGRVIDADTGADLKAKLVFVDEDGNGHSLVVNGKYRALLPPDKDVNLMVMVVPLGSRAPQRPIAPLRLEPGQEMHLDIPVANR